MQRLSGPDIQISTGAKSAINRKRSSLSRVSRRTASDFFSSSTRRSSVASRIELMTKVPDSVVKGLRLISTGISAPSLRSAKSSSHVLIGCTRASPKKFSRSWAWRSRNLGEISDSTDFPINCSRRYPKSFSACGLATTTSHAWLTTIMASGAASTSERKSVLVHSGGSCRRREGVLMRPPPSQTRVTPGRCTTSANGRGNNSSTGSLDHKTFSLRFLYLFLDLDRHRKLSTLPVSQSGPVRYVSAAISCGSNRPTLFSVSESHDSCCRFMDLRSNNGFGPETR